MQAEQVAAGPDPLGRRRQAFVAAAFGRGGQHVRMPHVVAAVDPAGEHHVGPVDLQVVAPVLRTLGHFVERESQMHVLLAVRAVTRAGQHPREHEGLEVRGAEHAVHRGVLVTLLGPGLPPALGLGDRPIGFGDVHVVAAPQRMDDARVLRGHRAPATRDTARRPGTSGRSGQVVWVVSRESTWSQAISSSAPCFTAPHMAMERSS